MNLQAVHDISVTTNKSYNRVEIIDSVRRHFEMLSLHEEIKPQMKVLLKPNLLMKRKPDEGTTTHPEVVAAIIYVLKEIGVIDITIADSPGGPYTKQMLTGIYEASGLRKIAEEFDVKLNFDFGSYVKDTENGVMVKSFTLINPIKNADYIIDIAKLKTHAMTTLSGGVKNIFGTVPGLMKPEFHLRFPEVNNFSDMLLDLCSTVNPDLTFVDAIVSMQGDGPSGGTLRNTGMLLGSKSPYNMDLALCNVIGVNCEKVPTVLNGIKRGLSVDDFSKLNIIGDKLARFTDFQMPKSKSTSFEDAIPRFIRRPTKAIMDNFFTSRPIITLKKCIGCGKCAESCPANTIAILNKKAKIDYSKCIKCFCCHEMCPVKAIEIKRSKLFNI